MLRERIAARLAAENGNRRGQVRADGDGRRQHGLSSRAARDLRSGRRSGARQDPTFFNHEMAVRIVGCRPVIVAADAHYQLDVAAIEAAVGPRTRAVVTVSPNNPSGAVYPESDLGVVNALCADRGLFHISDEVYEYFLFDGARHFSPGAIAGAENHTVCIYSLSKSYGFASWRVGYMLFPGATPRSGQEDPRHQRHLRTRSFAVRGGGSARRRPSGGSRSGSHPSRHGAPDCARCRCPAWGIGSRCRGPTGRSILLARVHAWRRFRRISSNA